MVARCSPARSYDEVPHWRRYLKHYPPELRGGADPVESWWPWGDVDVHVDRVPAPKSPWLVVLLHGVGGYGRMLLPFARLLVGGRAEILAPDLPGYGLSRAPRAVAYGDWVRCVADLVRAESGGRPIVLIGASMGGMLAYDVAARGGVAGVVATCLLDPSEPAVRRAVSRTPALGAIAPAALTALRPVADSVRVPIRWTADMAAMSNDPALTRLVAADPAGGGNRVSLRFLRTWLSSRPAVEPERFDACPVLLAHPGADRWTPMALSRAFLDRIAAPTELAVLEGAGHLPVEQPGLDQGRRAVARFLDRLAG